MTKHLQHIVIALAVLAGSTPLQAQNEPTNLAPFSSTTGTLDGSTSQDWTFTAVDGEVVSLIVESLDANLDPTLTLRSETGAVLLSNDDYDYPNSTKAVLQGVTIPFTGAYTASVGGTGGGDYTLTRLRGFADGYRLNGTLLTPTSSWGSPNEALAIETAADSLTLTLDGNDSQAIAVDEAAERLTDYYAQVAVNIGTGDPGWVVHITARQQSRITYYLLSINHDGLWRFSLYNNGVETVLRDWVTHPAIRPGETAFDLGIMANGGGFDLFYNGSPLGHIADSTLDEGITGLGIETLPALTSVVSATFEQFFVTVPLTTATGEDALPGQFILVEPQAMARALEHRRQIPTGGALALNVPESSAQANSPGVSRIALGRGTTYQNFVIATEVSIQTSSTEPAGCGIYMRAVDDENYVLAYLDQTGAYGLAERQGSAFLPGIFSAQEALREDRQQLMVVANGETLRYFINGKLVGTLQASDMIGGVGNAAVNFGVGTTTCTFANTWLWEWSS